MTYKEIKLLLWKWEVDFWQMHLRHKIPRSLAKPYFFYQSQSTKPITLLSRPMLVCWVSAISHYNIPYMQLNYFDNLPICKLIPLPVLLYMYYSSLQLKHWVRLWLQPRDKEQTWNARVIQLIPTLLLGSVKTPTLSFQIETRITSS